MTTNVNEGELSIQSPEVTSTVHSRVYMRRLNYFNVHQRRPLRPSLEPVLWNPNKENFNSRFVTDFLSSLNAVNNGNVVACIKSLVNDYCYFIYD
jgi:hypothetical protein